MEFTLEEGRQILEGTPSALRAMLAGLSDEWTASAEGPDAWTPWQVVAHLTHIEEEDWTGRTEAILRDGLERPFDPVDREAGFERYRGQDLTTVLDRLAELRARNLERITEIVGPGELDRQGLHPEFGPVTLRQLLATWVVHDLNHTGQIVKSMAKRYREAIGPWRANAPIVDLP
jgi:hypothetical protein